MPSQSLHKGCNVVIFDYLNLTQKLVLFDHRESGEAISYTIIGSNRMCRTTDCCGPQAFETTGYVGDMLDVTQMITLVSVRIGYSIMFPFVWAYFPGVQRVNREYTPRGGMV